MPIFTNYGCVNCHTPGGVAVQPGAAPVRGGYEAIWDADPDTVYENLTAMGTNCTFPIDDTSVQARVCTNDPENSLLVTRPLSEGGGAPDVHPIDIFPSKEDPGAAAIIDWISQGAQRGTSAPPVDFVSDVYPIFQDFGCASCHNDQSGVWNQIPVRGGFEPDWSATAQEVYDNLTGPGTNCAFPITPQSTAARVCTNDPENSLIVTRPLEDDPGVMDPHPVAVFDSKSDPKMALIIRWIEEGANFTP